MSEYANAVKASLEKEQAPSKEAIQAVLDKGVDADNQTVVNAFQAVCQENAPLFGATAQAITPAWRGQHLEEFLKNVSDAGSNAELCATTKAQLVQAVKSTI